MGKIVDFYQLYLFGLLGACAPTASNYSSATYTEDLSIYRTDERISTSEMGSDTVVKDQYTSVTEAVIPRQHITTEMNSFLDSLSDRNQGIRHVQGYTVQVYNGTSREAAQWSENRIYQIMDNAEPKIRYVQPNFKVKVGQFTDRLEAQKMFAELKKVFPNAIIIPERIKISR